MKQFIYKPQQSSQYNQAQAGDLDVGYIPSKSALSTKKEQYKKVLSGETQINSEGRILPGNNVPKKMGNIQAYIQKTGDRQGATNWALNGKIEGTKDYDETLKAIEGLGLQRYGAFNSPEQSSQRERDRQSVAAGNKLTSDRKKASVFQGAADIGRGFAESFEKTGAGIREVFGSDENLYRDLIDKKYKAKKSTIAKGVGGFAGDVVQVVGTGLGAGAGLKGLGALNKLNTARKTFVAGTALDAGLGAGHSALQARKGDKLKPAGIGLAFGAIPFATKGLQSIYKKIGGKVGGKMDNFLGAISDPLTINDDVLKSVKKSIYQSDISGADKVQAVKELTKTFDNAKSGTNTITQSIKSLPAQKPLYTSNKIKYNDLVKIGSYSKDGNNILTALSSRGYKPSDSFNISIVDGDILSSPLKATDKKKLAFWRGYSDNFDEYPPVLVKEGKNKISDGVHKAKVMQEKFGKVRIAEVNLSKPIIKKPSKSAPLIDSTIDNANITETPLKPKVGAISDSYTKETPKRLYTSAKRGGINEAQVKKAANELFGQYSLKGLSSSQLSTISNKLGLKSLKEPIKGNVKGTIYQSMSPSSKVLSELPEAQGQYYKLREAGAASHTALKATDDAINDKLNNLHPKSVKKIYAYLLQNTPDGIQALKRSGYKTPDKIITLNGPEKLAHDTIRKELDKTLVDLKNTGADIEGLENYMPLISKRKFFFDADVDVDFRTSLNPERKQGGFLKERKTGDVDIEPDLRQALNRYFQAANREIYVKPEALSIRKWIGDVDLGTSHPDASRYLDKLLDFTVEGAKEGGLVSKTFNAFKNRATSAALFLKPLSALMTTESAAAGIAKASPKSIAKSVTGLYGKPVWKDGKIISGDPSGESTELFQRMYDPDMNQGTTNFKSALKDASYDINGKPQFSFEQLGIIDRAIGGVGYTALKELDYISYKATFNANYYDGINKGLSHLDAVRKADDAAIATHSSSSRENRPAVQRGTFGKGMTSMLSPTIVSILEKVDMTKNLITGKSGGHLKALQTFALMSAGTYGVNEALNRGLDVHMPAFNPAQLGTAGFKLLNDDVKGFDKDMKDIENSIPLVGGIVQEIRLQIEEGGDSYKGMLPALTKTLESDSTKELGIGYRIGYKYIKDGIDAISDLRNEGDGERRKYSDDQIMGKLLRMSSLLALPNNMVSNLIAKPESLKERPDGSVEYHTERLDSNNPSLTLSSSGNIKDLQLKQRAGISPYSTNEASTQRIEERREKIREDKFRQEGSEKARKAFDSFLEGEVDINDIDQLNKQAPGIKKLVLNYYNNEATGSTKHDQSLQNRPTILKILETIKVIKSIENLPQDEQLKAIKDGQRKGLFDPKHKSGVELMMNKMKELNNNQ